MPRLATKKEQEYHDLASYYVTRAALCARFKLWPESEINFGASLEALLRIRYGPRPKFNKLIANFDADSLFNDLELHFEGARQCVTCSADKVRTLRNAIHPDCWREATEKDVLQAQLAVVGVYHIIAVCEGRIADFQPAPDTLLSENWSEAVS